MLLVMLSCLIPMKANAANQEVCPNLQQERQTTIMTQRQYDELEKQIKSSQSIADKNSQQQQFPEDFYEKQSHVNLNYEPMQGIGLRARNHFFPDEKEVEAIFRNNLSHLEQAYLWRTSILKELVDSELPLVITHADDQIYNIAHTRMTVQNGFMGIDFMISSKFYLQKWDFAKTDKMCITLKATQQKSIDIQPFTIQDPYEQERKQKISLAKDYLKELDVKQNLLRSNKSKTWLQITNDDFDNKDPRKNAYMNLGFDWQRTFKQYNEVSARFDDILVQEAMWTRLANQQAFDNYRKLINTFGADIVDNSNDPYALHKISFTLDPERAHRVSKPNSLMEGITPKEISDLTATEYGHKMFVKSFITIQPNIVLFNSAEILSTKKETIKLQNKSKSMILEIDEILTSSPEIHVILPAKDLKWPMLIKPGEEIEFIVLIVPEIKGLLKEAIYIPINKKYLYFMPVTMLVADNPLGLKPVFYTDVAVGQQIKHSVKAFIEKTKATEKFIQKELQIIEIYKTEPFIELYWPNGKQIKTDLDDTFNLELQPEDYLRLPVGVSKQIMDIRFTAREVGDHRAVVHIYTNSGILVRLPLYYHVTNDLLRFDPPIINFDYVPYRFDTMTIEVFAKIRTPQSDILTLVEVYLPMNDERLDFVIGNWAFDDKNIVKMVQENGRYRDVHRANIQSTYLHICTVALKPYKFGMIDTKIQLKVIKTSGVAEIVEVPIVGYVSPNAHPLRGAIKKENGERTDFHNFAPKEIIFDAEAIPQAVGLNDLGSENQPMVTASTQAFIKPEKGKEGDWSKGYLELRYSGEHPLIQNITNTFTRSLVQLSCPYTFYQNKFAINKNKENIFQDQNILIKLTDAFNMVEMHVKEFGPAEVLPFGNFQYFYGDTGFTANGHQYYGIYANFTQIPQLIQNFDQRVICQIFEQYQPIRYQDCALGVNLEFGRVGTYQTKSREVHITNPFNVDILIENIFKSQKYDDLSVYNKGIFDSKLISTPISEKIEKKRKEQMQQLVQKFDDKKSSDCFKSAYQHIVLKPGKTLKLVFAIEGASNLPASKKSHRSQSSLQINMLPQQIKSFKINYSYTAVQGQLYVQPSKFEFLPQPLLFSTIQEAEFTLKSTFKEQIAIMSVHSTDQRILPTVSQKTINGLTSVNALTITFDPGWIQPKQFSLSIQNKNSTEIIHRISQSEIIDSMQGQKITDEMISRTFHMDSPLFRNKKFEAASHVYGLTTLTVFDVAAWRSKRFSSKLPPQWIGNRWLRDVVEVIDAKVTIKSNVVDKLEVPVKAFIVEPKILQVREIDFGKVQIGTQVISDLIVSNPFNHTIAIEFYIGMNQIRRNHLEEQSAYDFQLQLEKTRIKALKSTVSINEDSSPSIPNTSYAKRQKDAIEEFKSTQKQTALEKLPNMKIWCARETFRNLLKQKEKQPNYGTQFGFQMLHLDETATKKLDAYMIDDEIFDLVLDGTEIDPENPNLLCHILSKLFTKNPKTQARHAVLWKQVDHYYKELLIEEYTYELNSKAENPRMKEFSRELNSLEEAKGLKNTTVEGLLDDQIRVLHEIDMQYYEEIMNCTFNPPYISDEIQKNRLHKSYLLAFPNPLKHGEMPFYLKFLIPQTYTRPIFRFQSWVSSIAHSEGFIDGFIKFLNAFPIISFDDDFQQRRGRQDILYRQSKMRKLKSFLQQYWKDFVEKKSVDPSFSPASALTRQFEIHNPELHEQFLLNNGTNQPELTVQNFYIHPFFAGRTTYLMPGQEYKFFDLIVFEPKILQQKPGDIQMTLYLKTGSTVLQTINLTGQSVASLMDVEYVQKIVQNYKPKTSFSLQEYLQSEQVGNITQSCNFLKQSRPLGKQMSVHVNGSEIVLDTTAKLQQHIGCLNEQQVMNNVYDQIFDHNTGTQQINLKVDLADVAEWLRYDGPKVESHEILESLQPSFIRSILNLFGLQKLLGAYKIFPDQPLPNELHWHIDYDWTNQVRFVKSAVHENNLNSVFGKNRQQNGLYNQIEWIITLRNLGEYLIDFNLIQIEDPVTGEISCEQEGLQIDNCSAKTVKDANQLHIRIIYTTDFTVSSLRKNLLISNAGWVQRFGIQLEIDSKAILMANQFSNFSPSTLGMGIGDSFSQKIPALRLIIVILTITITLQLKDAINDSNSLQRKSLVHFNLVNNQQTLVKTVLQKQIFPGTSPQQNLYFSTLLNSQQVNEEFTASSFTIESFLSAEDKFKTSQAYFLRECTNFALRKNLFTIDFIRKQNNAILKSRIIMETSKTVSQKIKRTNEKTDQIIVQTEESAPDSWRLEFSDKGSENEEIIPQITTSKKLTKKALKKMAAKQASILRKEEKAEEVKEREQQKNQQAEPIVVVLQQQEKKISSEDIQVNEKSLVSEVQSAIQNTYYVYAETKEQEQPQQQTLDEQFEATEVNSKEQDSATETVENKNLETKQIPKPATARLSKKEKKELEARKAKHAQLKQQSEMLEIARIKEQAQLAELAEKLRIKKIDQERREAEEQEERERYLAEIKASHERRLAREAIELEIERQKKLEDLRNEEEILSQIPLALNSRESSEIKVDQKSDSTDKGSFTQHEDQQPYRQVTVTQVQPSSQQFIKKNQKNYMPKSSILSFDQAEDKKREVIFTPSVEQKQSAQNQRIPRNSAFNTYGIVKGRSPLPEMSKSKHYEDEYPQFYSKPVREEKYQVIRNIEKEYENYKEEPKTYKDTPILGYREAKAKFQHADDRRVERDEGLYWNDKRQAESRWEQERFYEEEDDSYYQKRQDKRIKEQIDYNRSKYEDVSAADYQRENYAKSKKFDYGREKEIAWDQRTSAQAYYQQMKETIRDPKPQQAYINEKTQISYGIERFSKPHHYSREVSHTQEYYPSSYNSFQKGASSYPERVQNVQKGFTKTSQSISQIKHQNKNTDSSDDQGAFFKTKVDSRNDSESMHWKPSEAKPQAQEKLNPYQSYQQQKQQRISKPNERTIERNQDQSSITPTTSRMPLQKKAPSMQWQRIEKKSHDQNFNQIEMKPFSKHSSSENDFQQAIVENIKPVHKWSWEDVSEPKQPQEIKDDIVQNQIQNPGEFKMSQFNEKQDINDEKEQEKIQQTRKEASKKNFLDAFRSIKNIFSGNQAAVQSQDEDDEPVQSSNIFAGSMGLFSGPSETHESYSSAFRSPFGLAEHLTKGKTPFTQDTYDQIQKTPQHQQFESQRYMNSMSSYPNEHQDPPVQKQSYFGAQSNAYKPMQGYNDMHTFQPYSSQQVQQTQRYDPLNPGYIGLQQSQQQTQLQPQPIRQQFFAVPDQQPGLVKQPSSLEALRMNSKPLGLFQTQNQVQPTVSQIQTRNQAPKQQLFGAPEPQQEEIGPFNFQFKQLKPFNPNQMIRILEKSTKNEKKQ